LDVGEYQRLGEATLCHSNFRLIAATNRPLTDLRADVLARFAFRITIPDLSARPEDIPSLARHWLLTMAKADPALAKRFLTSEGEPQFSAEFVASLVKLPLPNNARELRNLLWEAICASEDGQLRLPTRSDKEGSSAKESESEVEPTASQLQLALEANDGSIEKTWRALGLRNRFALMRLMKKHAVQILRQPTR
jgi:two-component system nitrogen regulation response regulator GlnG/two-component system response regulator HydG